MIFTHRSAAILKKWGFDYFNLKYIFSFLLNFGFVCDIMFLAYIGLLLERRLYDG